MDGHEEEWWDICIDMTRIKSRYLIAAIIVIVIIPHMQLHDVHISTLRHDQSSK